MKKSFFFAISGVVFLFWPCTHATTVNPTPGDSTWTLVSRLGQVSDETTPIPVFNSDESGGVITLSSTGNYRVAENLIYPIVINVDKVCLDLNCKKISSSDGSTNLITVNSGLKNITIHNGLLTNTDTPTGTGAGILIQNGSSRIDVEMVRTVGCGNGVKLDGQDGNEVIECELVALDLVSNTTGLVLSHADENVIKSCCTFHNTQAGFELLNSKSNCFYDCQALKTIGQQSTMGFTSRAGQSNLFQRCVAKKTKTSASEFCNKAYGFLLTSTESKTKLVDCIVNETDVTSTVSAIAYGIHLAPILLEGSDLLNYITGDDEPGNIVNSVAWSPNGKYIASGDDRDYVRVFSFDGSNLFYIDGYSQTNRCINSVAWSPDGKYIVSGDNKYYVQIFSFDGSTLTYINGNVTPLAIFNSVAWSPDGKYIVSGSRISGSFDGYVKIFSFDGSTLTYINGNVTPGASVNSVAWSPDGKYIVSGSNDGYVRIFSFDGSTLTYINGNDIADYRIRSVAWSPDGKYIVSCDDDNYVRIFSFDGSNLFYITRDRTVTSRPNSVAWSPNGKYIINGCFDNYVRVFSFNGSTLTYINGNVTPGASVNSVAWSSDGKYIASGDNDGFVRVFDAMFGPQNCLIKKCTVCDTAAYGQFVGTGIAGGGNNSFIGNACCNNEVNYTYGVPNVYYGRHNIARNTVAPFDNISMPTTQ